MDFTHSRGIQDTPAKEQCPISITPTQTSSNNSPDSYASRCLGCGHPLRPSATYSKDESQRTLVAVHSGQSAPTPISCTAPLELLPPLVILASSRTRPPCCQIPAAGSQPRLWTTHSPRSAAAMLPLLPLRLHEGGCRGRRKLRDRSGAPRKLDAGTNARTEQDAEASTDTAQEPQALMILPVKMGTSLLSTAGGQKLSR